MAFDKNIIIQWIGGLIFILVYSAQAAQENSDTEGIFGSVPNDKQFFVFFLFNSMFEMKNLDYYCCIADHILIGAEENIQSIGLDGSGIDLATRSVYGSACTGGRTCVPMSECSAMYFEAAKTCFAGDRSMFCGGTQFEPYICCPKNPLEQNRVCGKSLVAGQFYKGLGAFPFVARIGFKSK